MKKISLILLSIFVVSIFLVGCSDLPTVGKVWERFELINKEVFLSDSLAISCGNKLATGLFGSHNDKVATSLGLLCGKDKSKTYGKEKIKFETKCSKGYLTGLNRYYKPNGQMKQVTVICGDQKKGYDANSKAILCKNGEALVSINVKLDTKGFIAEISDYGCGVRKLTGNIHTTKLYQKYSSLVPFPTKSTQPLSVLEKFGLVDPVSGQKTDLVGYYLLSGKKTQITPYVQQIAQQIPDGVNTEETIKQIILWIHQNKYDFESHKCTYEKQNKQSLRGQRTAEEIIKSGCYGGCTAHTIVFAALARAKGISTASTTTINEGWLAQQIKNQADLSQGSFYGHWYAEVYLPESGKWVVVDPTNRKLTGLNENKKYPLYNIKGTESHIYYVLFDRGLDPEDIGMTSDVQHRINVMERYYFKKYFTTNSVSTINSLW